MLRKFAYTFALLLLFNFAWSTEWQMDENFQINYEVVDDNLQITFILKNNKTGWMGVGFNEFMYPADTIVVWWDKSLNKAIIWDAYNPGIPTLMNFPAPLRDNNPLLLVSGRSPLDNQENVEIISATNQNGTITIKTERKLVTGDIFDLQFELGREYRIVAAYNASEVFINEFNALQPMHTNTGSAMWTIPANENLGDLP